MLLRDFAWDVRRHTPPTPSQERLSRRCEGDKLGVLFFRMYFEFSSFRYPSRTVNIPSIVKRVEQPCTEPQRKDPCPQDERHFHLGVGVEDCEGTKALIR